VPIGDLANRAAAEPIAADGCDLVIELKGWTSGTRGQLLAARPAAGACFLGRTQARDVHVARVGEHSGGRRAARSHRRFARRLFRSRARALRDGDAFARLEARVAQARASALFYTKRFTHGIEAAFAAMVARQRAGLASDHIAVAQP
jgi:hypothetical protein